MKEINNSVYKYAFFTNKDIYDIMLQYLPKLDKVVSRRQLALWINEHKHHFGDLKRKRVNNMLIEGRYLWSMREFARSNNCHCCKLKITHNFFHDR